MRWKGVGAGSGGCAFGRAGVRAPRSPRVFRQAFKCVASNYGKRQSLGTNPSLTVQVGGGGGEGAQEGGAVGAWGGWVGGWVGGWGGWVGARQAGSARGGANGAMGQAGAAPAASGAAPRPLGLACSPPHLSSPPPGARPLGAVARQEDKGRLPANAPQLTVELDSRAGAGLGAVVEGEGGVGGVDGGVAAAGPPGQRGGSPGGSRRGTAQDKIWRHSVPPGLPRPPGPER